MQQYANFMSCVHPLKHKIGITYSYAYVIPVYSSEF